MKHISSSLLNVSRCRETKQKRTVNLCIKSESWHFLSRYAVKKMRLWMCLGGLKLYVWPVLTWTGSSESLSSPREPRGPGKPLGLSSSEWHCNTKQETVRTMSMRPISGDDKTLLTPSGINTSRDGGFEIRSYMISVSSQWELAGISSTFSMWRPIGLLSVWMQRQCSSTPRLAVRRQVSHGHKVQQSILMTLDALPAELAAVMRVWIARSYLHWWRGRPGAPQ